MKRNLITITTCLCLAAGTAFADAAPKKPALPFFATKNMETGDHQKLVPILAALFLLAVVTGGSSVVIAPSDERLKTDIKPVGTAHNGLPLYEYRYVGGQTVYRGVMAQDVLSHTPEAVVMLPGGYMGVNYGMLGLSMTTVR